MLAQKMIILNYEGPNQILHLIRPLNILSNTVSLMISLIQNLESTILFSGPVDNLNNLSTQREKNVVTHEFDFGLFYELLDPSKVVSIV